MLRNGTTVQILDAVMIFEIARWAAAIATIAGVLAGFIRYAVVAPIKAYIDLKTYPIQSYANGGKSLPDVLKALESVQQDIRTLKSHVEALERNTPPF